MSSDQGIVLHRVWPAGRMDLQYWKVVDRRGLIIRQWGEPYGTILGEYYDQRSARRAHKNFKEKAALGEL